MKRMEYPQLGESLYQDVLPNGLQLMVLPRPGFSRKLAYFVTDFGAIHRDFLLDGEKVHAPAGIAHFLEHKMFELPDGRDVSAELASLGAVTNAFTSHDMTAYYIGCTENFDAALDLLLEFVSTPYFTSESVEKEWGIIDQEIGMELDSPEGTCFRNLMTAMYKEHRIREEVLGDCDSIREITPELLHACHRAFYTPGNMLLCVVGDVDPDRVAELALNRLGREKKSVGEKVYPWTEDMTVCQLEVRGKMEVAMPMFNLGFKCEPTGKGEEAIRQEILGDLAAEALFGESSQVYLKLYETGLIDSSFGGGFETIDGMAMLLCSGDSNDPVAVREELLARSEELVRDGIPEEQFRRMKRSAFGRRVRDLDSFDSSCFRLCAYKMADFDYFDFPRVYQSIQREEIQEFLARVVRRERCALSVIDPA